MAQMAVTDLKYNYYQHLPYSLQAFYYTPQELRLPDYETFFKDGLRRIDMVLAYTEDLSNPDQSISRRNFELNLISDGLELELEDKAVSFNFLLNMK